MELKGQEFKSEKYGILVDLNPKIIERTLLCIRVGRIAPPPPPPPSLVRLINSKRLC